MLEGKAYENLRDKCIEAFRVLYKDTLVFDYCKVPKDVRVKLSEDADYVAATKALKAGLFKEQLDTLDKVMSGHYQGEKATDQSGTILKALEMKNKLLLEDLNVNRDESMALNVVFVSMSREDFNKCGTVEIFEGSNNEGNLGADFAGGEDTDSFEARMRAEVTEKLKKEKEAEEEKE